MTPNKTVPTKISVKEFIESLPDSDRKKETKVLVKQLTQISGKKATMWGSSIIGFGEMHYKYESGREGDQMVVGFSPRKPALSIYGLAQALSNSKYSLAQFGASSMGKGCIYFKKLDSMNSKILEALVTQAFASASE